MTSSSLSPDAGAHVLTFRGTRAGFEEAFRSFRRLLDNCALSERAHNRCELVFEEIVTNVVSHGYRDASDHDIEVVVQFPADSIVMRFEDDGVPFDASVRPALPLPPSTGDVAIGVRGLRLVHSVAHGLDYTRTATGRNRLTVTIRTTP